jgi:hypothetical protein
MSFVQSNGRNLLRDAKRRVIAVINGDGNSVVSGKNRGRQQRVVEQKSHGDSDRAISMPLSKPDRLSPFLQIRVENKEDKPKKPDRLSGFLVGRVDNLRGAWPGYPLGRARSKGRRRVLRRGILSPTLEAGTDVKLRPIAVWNHVGDDRRPLL